MIYHVAFRGGGRDTERGVGLCGWLCDLCETRTPGEKRGTHSLLDGAPGPVGGLVRRGHRS